MLFIVSVLGVASSSSIIYHLPGSICRLDSISIMSWETTQTAGVHPDAKQDNEVLRLEGLVVQTRLTHVETTRYLVIDFNAGSVSLYMKPPPKNDLIAQQKQNKSLPSKLLSSVTPSLMRSKSEDVACENLAHISRQQRHFPRGVWEPKFTASSAVDWKLR